MQRQGQDHAQAQGFSIPPSPSPPRAQHIPQDAPSTACTSAEIPAHSPPAPQAEGIPLGTDPLEWTPSPFPCLAFFRMCSPPPSALGHALCRALQPKTTCWHHVGLVSPDACHLM